MRSFLMQLLLSLTQMLVELDQNSEVSVGFWISPGKANESYGCPIASTSVWIERKRRDRPELLSELRSMPAKSVSLAN